AGGRDRRDRAAGADLQGREQVRPAERGEARRGRRAGRPLAGAARGRPPAATPTPAGGGGGGGGATPSGTPKSTPTPTPPPTPPPPTLPPGVVQMPFIYTHSGSIVMPSKTGSSKTLVTGVAGRWSPDGKS